MPPQTSVTPPRSIERMILLIRGQQVLLDADLASLYQVETKALLQAVKRNRYRFPYDFFFQLTDQECMQLGSRAALGGSYGGRRYRPYAFTEQGAGMLASVLRNPISTNITITILRAFAQLRTPDEPESSQDRLGRKAFAIIRDAFLLQRGDEGYTTREPCTYFLQADPDGPIKIGSTTNLPVRLRSLSTMSPVRMKLLGIIPSDAEEICHGQLGAFRLHGEWFAPSPVVLDFIRQNAVTSRRE